MNLTFASATRAVLRVDNTETNASTGRHSARLTSKNQYTTGLFIFDVVNCMYTHLITFPPHSPPRTY